MAGQDWRVSTYSNGGEATCVETATGTTGVLVRDSTDRAGVTLSVSGAAWATFLTTLR
jgi:hypothetical protein